MFTNNRLDFYNNKAYEEKSHASALGKGIPSFVVKGLDLTGTTLTAGIFTNTGTFGQLGLAGETHTITANYTGYVIIKSTLNGVNSVSTIELSATRNDSDPTIVSNIKYFTIYKLNNGVIEEDYRHSNYIKDISFQNVGGSNFVQVINGTKSNPFDASTFAGNRTLLDDKDIGWVNDETSVVLLKDDLKTMFDSCQALVGPDKPFILTFTCDEGSPQYNGNFGAKVFDLIFQKYGYLPIGLHTFTMYGGAANGVTSESNSSTNKCTLWNKTDYFEFEFNYGNFDNVIVRDAEGHAGMIMGFEVSPNLDLLLTFPTQANFNNGDYMTIEAIGADYFELLYVNGVDVRTEFTRLISQIGYKNVFNTATASAMNFLHGWGYDSPEDTTTNPTQTHGNTIIRENDSRMIAVSHQIGLEFPGNTSVGCECNTQNFINVWDTAQIANKSTTAHTTVYVTLYDPQGKRKPVFGSDVAKDVEIMTPNIEPEIDNGVRGDK